MSKSNHDNFFLKSLDGVEIEKSERITASEQCDSIRKHLVSLPTPDPIETPQKLESHTILEKDSSSPIIDDIKGTTIFKEDGSVLQRNEGKSI